jgi:hypothetical protein
MGHGLNAIQQLINELLSAEQTLYEVYSLFMTCVNSPKLAIIFGNETSPLAINFRNVLPLF